MRSVSTRRINGLDDDSLIDSMRLAQAAGALAGENDYFRYRQHAGDQGLPGEAKAVLDQGSRPRRSTRAKATFSQLYTLRQPVQGDRASLAASARRRRPLPAPKAMVTAEAYYGYGDMPRRPNCSARRWPKGRRQGLANLRLGMALARGRRQGRRDSGVQGRRRRPGRGRQALADLSVTEGLIARYGHQNGRMGARAAGPAPLYSSQIGMVNPPPPVAGTHETARLGRKAWGMCKCVSTIA